MAKRFFAEGNQFGKLATGIPKTFTEKGNVARLSNLEKARTSPKYANRDLSIPLARAWAARARKHRHKISQFDREKRKAYCEECGWTVVKIYSKPAPRGDQILCYVSSLSYDKNGTPIPTVSRKDQAWELWEQQDGKCKICGVGIFLSQGKNKSAILDHCHATGNIRSWLCQGCNQGLGGFRDNPEALRLAAEYLVIHHQAGLAEESTNGKRKTRNEY